MSSFKIMACVGVGLLAAMLPQAKADAYNQKTIFTFSGPVEIPGQVLPAGTYVFQLADSQSDRNIVQVFNKRMNHIFGTFLAIPDYRLRVTGRPIITFEERAAGAPEAVRAWFYPGDNYGHAFVYPKKRAVVLAAENNTPVAAVPNEYATKTTTPQQLKQAPVTAVQPNQQQEQITQAFPPPPANQTTGAASRTLPQTASPLPLFGLIGLLSLGAAGLLLSVGRGSKSEGK